MFSKATRFSRENWRHHAAMGVLAVSVSVIVALSGCSGNGLNLNEKVATVDGTIITKADYDKVANQVKRIFNLDAKAEADKNPMIQEAVKRMAMEKLIVGVLLRNDAKKEGVIVTADEIKKFKDEKVKEIGGEENLKLFLSENHLTEQELNDKIEEELLRTKFFEKKGGKNAPVSEKEAEAFYNSHPTEFQVPETIDSSHILVKSMDNELTAQLKKEKPSLTDAQLKEALKTKRAELKAKAQKLYDEVTQSPDKFAEVATKNSDDVVSARAGGALGPHGELELDPTFWGALKKTKPGSIHKGVVETQFGYHIIQVKDHVSPHKQTFTEAKAKITDYLSQKRMKEAMQTWFQDKMSNAKIVIEENYKTKDPAELAQEAAKSGKPGQGPRINAPQGDEKQ